MSSNKRNNLTKKIKDYSALAGAFIAAGPLANGAAVCTDINTATTACGDRVFIDIDGDGTDDFVAVVGYGSSSLCNIGTMFPLGANQVAASTGFYVFSAIYNLASTNTIGYAYALSYGADVAGNNFLGSRRITLNTFDGYGNWIGAYPLDAYLAVQFDIGGNSHYGWIHLEYTGGGIGTTHAINVLDVGYEDQPGTTLTTGQCDPDQAPIPTLGEWGLISLTLLSLTFGVLALRRREMVLSDGTVVDSDMSLEINKPSFSSIKDAFRNFFNK